MGVLAMFKGKKKSPLQDGPKEKHHTFPAPYIAAVHDELIDRFNESEELVKAGQATDNEVSILTDELKNLNLALEFKLRTDPTIERYLPDYEDFAHVVLSEEATRYLVDVLSWPILTERAKPLVEAVEAEATNDKEMHAVAISLHRMDFSNPSAWGIGLGIEQTLKALGKTPQDVVGPNDRRWITGQPPKHPIEKQRG